MVNDAKFFYNTAGKKQKAKAKELLDWVTGYCPGIPSSGKLELKMFSESPQLANTGSFQGKEFETTLVQDISKKPRK